MRNSKGINAGFAFIKQASEFPDLGGRVLGAAICLAFNLVGRRHDETTFGYCIGNISSCIPYEQVCGIAARRIIAPMQAIKTFWNRAMSKGIGIAMRFGNSLPIPERSIPIPVVGGPPLPTIIRAALVNLLPETLKGWANLANFGLMPRDEAHGLAFDMPFARVASFGDGSGLAAATFTEFYSGIVRGIMGLHQKLAFLVSSLGTIPVVAGALRVQFSAFKYTTSMSIS